jgi:hypothetical protein
MLPRCSPKDIRDGDDHNFADFGESLQRRTVKIWRLRLNEFDSRSMDAQSIMAELRGLFSWHGRAYSSEVKFTGARVCGHLQRRARERKGCSFRVLLGGGDLLIVDLGRRPSSCTSRRQQRIERLDELQRAASAPRLKMTKGDAW